MANQILYGLLEDRKEKTSSTPQAVPQAVPQATPQAVPEAVPQQQIDAPPTKLQSFMTSNPEYGRFTEEQAMDKLFEENQYYQSMGWDKFAKSVGYEGLSPEQRANQPIEEEDEDIGSEMWLTERAYRGYASRANEVLLNGVEALDDTSKWMSAQQMKYFMGMRGLSYDSDKVDKLFRETENDNFVTDLKKGLKKNKEHWDYEVKYDMDRLLDSKGAGETVKNTLGLMFEQGVVSGPDMLAMIASTPLYLLSRLEEVSDTRAINKFIGSLPQDATPEQVMKALNKLGKENIEDIEGTGKEFIEAIPSTGLVIASEKFQIGRLLPDSFLKKWGLEGMQTAAKTQSKTIKEGAKATLKEGLVQGAYETGQEGVEYLGETLYTGREVDGGEMLKRMGTGGLAGKGTGVVFGGMRATGEVYAAKKEDNNAEKAEENSQKRKEQQKEVVGTIVPEVEAETDVDTETETETDSPFEGEQPVATGETTYEEDLGEAIADDETETEGEMPIVVPQDILDLDEAEGKVLDDEGWINLAEESGVNVAENFDNIINEFHSMMTPQEIKSGRYNRKKVEDWILSKGGKLPEAKKSSAVDDILNDTETTTEGKTETASGGLTVAVLAEMEGKTEAQIRKGLDNMYLIEDENGIVQNMKPDSEQFLAVVEKQRLGKRHKSEKVRTLLEKIGLVKEDIDAFFTKVGKKDAKSYTTKQIETYLRDISPDKDAESDVLHEAREGGLKSSDRTPRAVNKNKGTVGVVTQEQIDNPPANSDLDPSNRRAAGVDAYGNVYTDGDGEAYARERQGQLQDTTVDENVDYLSGEHGPMPRNKPNAVTPSEQTNVKLAGGRGTGRLGTKKNPITLNRVMNEFIKFAGNRYYFGNMGNSKAAGFYQRRGKVAGTIVTAKKLDIDTVAHETAHFLDFNEAIRTGFQKFYRGSQQVKSWSYTSHPDKVNKEGFAEFVRMWLTQYDVLTDSSIDDKTGETVGTPEAVAEFEKLLQQDPMLWKAMLDLQEVSHGWYAQGAAAQLRAKSGDKRTMKDKIREFLRTRPFAQFRQSNQDEIHALKVMEREILGDFEADGLLTKDSPFKLMRLARGGAESIYRYVLEYGTIRINSKTGDLDLVEGSKSLQQVFEPVTKDIEMWRDFMDYMVARRAQELDPQGREQLITEQNQEAGLAYNEQYLDKDGNKIFEQAFSDYQKFNDQMLDFYVQSGLISADQKADFIKMNKDYVPFHRIREGMLQMTHSGSKGISRLYGGENVIDDIGSNITEGVIANIQGALEARAKRAMYKLIASDEVNGPLWATEIPKDNEMASVQASAFAESMAKVLVKLGMGVTKKGMPISHPQGKEGVYVEFNDIQTVLEEQAASLGRNVKIQKSEDGKGFDVVDTDNDNAVVATFRTRADAVAATKDYSQQSPLTTMFAGKVKPTSSEHLIDSVIDENGVERFYKIQDPLLVNMMQHLAPEAFGPMMGGALRLKGVMTRSITSMPEFQTANMTRDTLHAYNISKEGFWPVKDSLIGLNSYIKKDAHYQEMMRNGMLFSSNLDAATKEGRARKQLDLPSANAIDAAAKELARLDELVGASEYATRLGEARLARMNGDLKVRKGGKGWNVIGKDGKVEQTFKTKEQAVNYKAKAGKSALDSAWSGRNISGDFTTRGNGVFAKYFIRTVPFYNASMVGLVRTAQAIKDEQKAVKQAWLESGKDPKVMAQHLAKMETYKRSFIAKGMGLTAFSMVAHGISQDDERYKDLTDDQKSRYWHIFYDKDEPPIKLRKPFELGTIFGTVPIAMIDYWVNEDSEEFRDAMLYAMIDTLGFAVDQPSYGQVLWEQIENETFTGAPIVPQTLADMKYAQTRSQYNVNTPLIYKDAAKLFYDTTGDLPLMDGEGGGISPLRLQHATKGTWGYVANWVEDAYEWKFWNESLYGERPFVSHSGDRIVKQFVGRDVEYRTKYTKDYWELMERAKSVQSFLSREEKFAAQKMGRSDYTYKDLLKENPEFKVAYAALGETYTNLSEMATSIKELGTLADMIKVNGQTTDGKPKSDNNEWSIPAKDKLHPQGKKDKNGKVIVLNKGKETRIDDITRERNGYMKQSYLTNLKVIEGLEAQQRILEKKQEKRNGNSNR